MKNWEKYEEELREIGVANFSVVNGEVKSCTLTNCCECLFNSTTCDDESIDWLYNDVDKIVVGDFVKYIGVDTRIVYVTYTDDLGFSGIGVGLHNSGMTYTRVPSDGWTKTGKHIPLDKVIKFIGGDK